MAQMGTYWITEKTTNKVYFGSTQNLDVRLDRHWRELQQNTHHNVGLQELWNNGLRDFTITIRLTETRDEAYRIEESMITFFSKTDKCLNIGLSARGGDNLTRNPNKDQIVDRIKNTIKDRYSKMTKEEKKHVHGLPGILNGMYGRKHTEEAKEIMRLAHIGNKIWLGRKHKASSIDKLSEHAKLRLGPKNPFYGKNHSDKTKQKIALANRGRLPPNTMKVEIDGKSYNSATEASRLTKISLPTILFRIRSKNPKFRSYCFLT